MHSLVPIEVHTFVKKPRRAKHSSSLFRSHLTLPNDLEIYETHFIG